MVVRDLSFFPVGLSILVPDPIGPVLGWGGGCGVYEARATLSEGGIQPQHISKPG